MTSTQALKRLATNRLDLLALEALYSQNQAEIDLAIRQWFGSGSVVQDATSRVLARIAACASAFKPTVYTVESFIGQIVEEECKRIYDNSWNHAAPLRDKEEEM